MIKLACFDFSKTVAKDTGFGAGPAFLGRKPQYDDLYRDFKSGKLNEESFVESTVKLWKGLKTSDLQKLYSGIKLNPNIMLVLKRLHNLNIKSALISYIPTKLAELYLSLGFDYISGTNCEIKNRAFTGKVIKISSDKGEVIKNFCSILKIRPNQAIAIGDSINDIKMFKIVGYNNSFGYNVSPNVRKYTKHNIQDFKEIIPIIKVLK